MGNLKDTMETQLGLHQAMATGYTYWGYEGEKWQTINKLADLDYSCFEGKKMYLFDKEPSVVSINEEDLRDLIADHIEDNHSSETGDDTMEVYETVKALNFDQTVAYINQALSKHRVYHLTKIRVVYDEPNFRD